MQIKNKINLYTIGIVIILVFSFIIRTYNLSSNPPGFFADEASIGYNAYTILTKGTDEYGINYPLFFRAFGEYKSPLQIYATIPFVALFGLNEFSVRLTSVFFGTLGIFAIYLLTKELFKKYKHNAWIALFSALFLAISPWHIHFSRIAFESMPFVFFATLGLYFFLRSQRNVRILTLCVITFVLAIYSYFPARIFIPLFGLGIIIVYNRFFLKHKKQIFLNFILLLFLITPLILFTLSPSGFARWNQVNIISQPPKNETVSQHIFTNYISHFSLDFLFFKGDIDMPGQFITRHSVRGMGELYLLQLPLVILGFLYLFSKREKKLIALLILWLILYPTGSMFTIDKSAQATRSIIGVVPFQILSAVGLWFIFTMVSKVNKILNYSLLAVITAIILFSFTNYLNSYFIRYRIYSSDFWGWQYGAREIVQYFKENESKYDELIMAPEFNAPDIFFKFYAPNNCSKCRIGLSDTNYNPSVKQLFAVTPTYLREHPSIRFKRKKTIYQPNGTIAFQIGEIVR